MADNNDRAQTWKDGVLVDERRIDDMPIEALRSVLRVAAKTIDDLQKQLGEEEHKRHAMQELATVCLARLGGAIEIDTQEYLQSYDLNIEIVPAEEGKAIFRLLQPPVSSCN